MKFKHTPGPWIITDHEYLSFKILHGPKLSPDGKNVYVVYASDTTEMIEQQAADVRLISCTPEMIEVLIEARATIQYLKRYVEGGALSAVDAADESIKTIDAIIERATGMKIEHPTPED